MKYSVIKIGFVSDAKKFLKKCLPELRDILKDTLSAVYDDIEAGIALDGDLIGCYKFIIDFKGVSYSAVYVILNENEVKVVYCGTRKNAYK